MTEITKNDILEVGGIVHRDGNIFFTNISLLTKLINKVKHTQTTVQPECALTYKEQIAKNKRDLLQQMQAQPEQLADRLTAAVIDFVTPEGGDVLDIGAQPEPTHKYEFELPDGDSRQVKCHWAERIQAGNTITHKLCLAVSEQA